MEGNVGPSLTSSLPSQERETIWRWRPTQHSLPYAFLASSRLRLTRWMRWCNINNNLFLAYWIMEWVKRVERACPGPVGVCSEESKAERSEWSETYATGPSLTYASLRYGKEQSESVRRRKRGACTRLSNTFLFPYAAPRHAVRAASLRNGKGKARLRSS